MNITEEQAINQSLQMCTQGGQAAFRFARWFLQYLKTHTADGLQSWISEACSAYRGGYCSGDREQLQRLIRDLAGTDDARLDGNFIWTGNRSDLSYFWKKVNDKDSAILLKSYVDSIPDDALRGRVISTVTQARMDGFLTFDGRSYALTEKGRNLILKPDFIVSRLRNECKMLGILAPALQGEKDAALDDRITAKLKSLGIEDRYQGHDRITINKDRLLISETEQKVQCYVPGTGRKMQIVFDRSDLIDLDEKTYAGFLHPEKQYRVMENKVSREISGKDLFKHYDNKNKIKKDLETAIDRSVAQSAMPVSGMSTIHPDRAGNWFVFRGDEIRQYTVTRGWPDLDGTMHYNLKAVDGQSQDILLPDTAFDRIAFRDPDAGAEYIASHPEVRSAERVLEVQEPSPSVQAKEFTLKDGWHEDSEHFLIATKGAEFEKLQIPKADAVPQPDGSLTVTLRPDQAYQVKTGDVGYSVSHQGAERIMTSGGRKVTVRASQTSMQGAKTSAHVAGQTANTVTKTVDTAANVVPPVETVSAAVKTALKVTAKVGQAVSTTVSVSGQGMSPKL